MLSAGYWCEEGCHGRIELRQHKGHLFASLHYTTSDLAQTAFVGPTATATAAPRPTPASLRDMTLCQVESTM